MQAVFQKCMMMGTTHLHVQEELHWPAIQILDENRLWLSMKMLKLKERM